MFAQGIGTSSDLLSIQTAAPLEVQLACSLLASNDLWVALPGILLIAWIAENAVHIGEPMRTIGCCSLRRASALVRCALLLKSYGCPVSS